VYGGLRKQESNSTLAETYDGKSLKLALQGNKLLYKELKRYLLQAIDDTPGSLVSVKQRLEDWFNAGMDRLTDNYKKKIRFWTLLVAFAVAFAANVDTIALHEIPERETGDHRQGYRQKLPGELRRTVCYIKKLNKARQE
jgi:hypothetical protein